MSTNPSVTTHSRIKEKTGAQTLATDTVVYLVLILLTWGTWQFSQQDYFEAGDDVGYLLNSTQN